MFGVVQFVRWVFVLGVALSAAGTLIEATGCVGRAAAKAHQHGGISFRWLNRQLVENQKQNYKAPKNDKALHCKSNLK